MLVARAVLVNRGRWTAFVASAVVTLSMAWGTTLAQAAQKPAKRTTCSTADYHGNSLLGPKSLPNAGPLAPMLKGYRRFGGMRSTTYLDRFYYSNGNQWLYPPLGGYLLTPSNPPVPVKMQVSLFPGMEVDVFGDTSGLYLAPAGTPYAARSIPPQTLDSTTDPQHCDYLLFYVLRTIPVQSGPIAPGLAEPGFGVQYVLDNTIFPGSPPSASFDIAYLVANGYLQHVPVKL
jgi:hypothetical protein